MNLYEPIKKKLEQLKISEPNSKKEKIVLITTGALNPIHIGHLNMLKIAQDNLEKKGFEILCSFISPSSDSYLSDKKKYGKPNFFYFPFEFRCEMCKAAIEEFNNKQNNQNNNNNNNNKYNFAIHDWEGNLKGNWIDFPYVKKHIDKELKEIFPNENICSFYVCGSDLFGYAMRMGKNVVGIKRKNDKIHFDKKYEEKNIFLFENEGETLDTNSTDIRNILMYINEHKKIKGKNLNDDEYEKIKKDLDKKIYPSVLNIALKNINNMI